MTFQELMGYLSGACDNVLFLGMLAAGAWNCQILTTAVDQGGDVMNALFRLMILALAFAFAVGCTTNSETYEIERSQQIRSEQAEKAQLIMERMIYFKDPSIQTCFGYFYQGVNRVPALAVVDCEKVRYKLVYPPVEAD